MRGMNATTNPRKNWAFTLVDGKRYGSEIQVGKSGNDQ
jgi:hypothetical protein